MKVVRKEKLNKKKKQKQIIEQKKIYTPWKVRSKKYSEYPYIVTVSFFRKNVFLSASDLRGRIKYWTNAGRLGFKGGDKTQYMAIVTVAESFFKKLTRYGIRDVFLKFKNYKRPRNAIKKAIRNLKLTGSKRRKKYKIIRRLKWKWVPIKGKNGKKKNKRIQVWMTMKKKRKGVRKVRFLGIWTELHVSFNGCRNKKQRRKRHRRKAKRIHLK